MMDFKYRPETTTQEHSSWETVLFYFLRLIVLKCGIFQSSGVGLWQWAWEVIAKTRRIMSAIVLKLKTDIIEYSELEGILKDH